MLGKAYKVKLSLDSLRGAHPGHKVFETNKNVCNTDCIENFPLQVPNYDICGLFTLFNAYVHFFL